MAQIETEPVPLPASLTLHYPLPVELHQMSQALCALLKQHGCTLNVVFHPVKSWHRIDQLDEAEIVMGDG